MQLATLLSATNLRVCLRVKYCTLYTTVQSTTPLLQGHYDVRTTMTLTRCDMAPTCKQHLSSSVAAAAGGTRNSRCRLSGHEVRHNNTDAAAAAILSPAVKSTAAGQGLARLMSALSLEGHERAGGMAPGVRPPNSDPALPRSCSSSYTTVPTCTSSLCS